MSTTKRPRATIKKEPAKPRKAAAKSAASAAVTAAKAKSRAAAADRERAAEPAAPPEPAPPPPPAAPVKKVSARIAKSVAAARAAAEEAAANRPIYDLDGPVPPEGAAFGKQVGGLLAVGQKALGIKTFRPGQAEAFEHILHNEDLLAVMPTGSGKSLLYQLPSLVLPGVTVVVSPLIALIKDQIDKMVAKGVAAVRVDSTLTTKQRREVDEMIKTPGGKLLLTTPERMADPEFRTFLREACGGVGVSRFVVDEAHCVSQWGHDFRPAYLSLRKALEDVGRPPVLATTATAPPHVRDDILFQLGMEGATTVTTTFDRPNLHYEVIVFSDEGEKMKTLVTLLKKLPRPGIVYCATVKKVEELYEALTRHGLPVARYHGRMNKGERDESQQTFMDSPDQIMIATNAFGLGVDKANIRNVLHYHVPGSLEAYAQEAGRGGRDGKPARCVLLFSPDDVAIQEYFLSGTYPTKRQVRQVYEAVEAFTDAHRSGGHLAEDADPTVHNIALSSGVGQQRTRTVLSLLKDELFITEKEGGHFFLVSPPRGMDELMERARQYEARRIADRQRLDSLLAYVKAPSCRNQVILQYLGEPDAPKCGRCDNCLRSREAALAASTEATRLGFSVTRQLDEEPLEKPKREIKARVVRIDAPKADAAPAAAPAPVVAKPTVLRRSGSSAAAPVAPPKPAPAPEPVVVAAPAPVAKTANPEEEELDEDDDDLEDDDELEGEDGELADDEDDDDDDDLDDDEDDDDDDDDEDDDDEDDDDYEVIDKTAAELAEEGVEGPGEITVLARKRVPKVPKQRPSQVAAGESPSASAAEARRRRRRRRRKRRAMLPPKSAFTTPVMSTESPMPMSQPRRGGGGGGGPVIEYVRGPMRIATAPVASANPNDAGVARRRGKKLNRWERNDRFERRGGGGGAPRPGGGGGGGDRPRGNWSGGGGSASDRVARQENGPGYHVRPNGGGPDGANGGPSKKRRRRRRRRGPDGLPINANGAPGASTGANGNGAEAPVAFFAPTNPSNSAPAGNGGNGGGGQNGGPIVLGPDGQPLRKRRRRRRRGRGGKQRELRGPGGPGGPEGAIDAGDVGDGGDHGGDGPDGDHDDGGGEP